MIEVERTDNEELFLSVLHSKEDFYENYLTFVF